MSRLRLIILKEGGDLDEKDTLVFQAYFHYIYILNLFS